MQNKKRTVTVRRVMLNIRIADLIALLSSSLQHSEGGGDGDSGDSCACDREMKYWQNFLSKFNNNNNNKSFIFPQIRVTMTGIEFFKIRFYWILCT